MNAAGKQRAPSFAFYSPDVLGLGHLRRMLALADGLRARWPGLTQLLCTGSPAACNFALPDHLDYVKLPSMYQVAGDHEPEPYVSRTLPLTVRAMRDLRRDLLLSLARHFQPDVFVVDYMAAGLLGELVPALRHLKEVGRTRFVLSVRDIVGEKPTTQVFARDGAYDLLDELYDLILVFGQQEIWDLVTAAELPPRAAARTRHVGYLRRQLGSRSLEQVRAALGLQTDRLVLVTAGGGVDGYHIFRAMLDALRQWPTSIDFDCLLVTGPFMPPADRQSIADLLPAGLPVRCLDFAETMTEYVAAADVVVSMAGYNSLCEILSFGRPAVVIPRARLPAEQLLRARALHAHGLARVIHPLELTPARLLKEVRELLAGPPRLEVTLNLDGLPAALAEIEALLPQYQQETPERAAPPSSAPC